LGISESTVKRHRLEFVQILGVEAGNAATLRAMGMLGPPGRAA
jgi:hypothetical protein